MTVLPTIAEAKKIASTGEYKVLPVSCEILSDICTPIEAMKILKNVSTHCYMLESMHGKQSDVRFDLSCPLFAGCPEIAPVARYHSLAADADTIPNCLKVTAVTTDGEVMAVKHTEYPIYGVQFHPESIMTPDGKTMLRNFIKEL